jgi:peptidylprolyl isomerase
MMFRSYVALNYKPIKEKLMQKVENGMFVSVNYTGTLNNGEQFDSSEGRPPLEFKVGSGQIIKGFDTAVVGMLLNEEKTFTLAPEDAYGSRNEDHKHELPRAEIPSEITPEMGQILALTSSERQHIPARIVAMDEEKVTFDLNHPLAGQSLTFKIKVVGISDTPTQKPESCGSNCSSGCSC